MLLRDFLWAPSMGHCLLSRGSELQGLSFVGWFITVLDRFYKNYARGPRGLLWLVLTEDLPEASQLHSAKR